MDPITELKALRHELNTFTKSVNAGDTVSNEQAARIDTVLERSAELAEIVDRGRKAADAARPFAEATFEEDADGNVTRSVEAKAFLTPEALKRTIHAEVKAGTKAFVAGGSQATATQFDTNPTPLARPIADLNLVNVLPVTVRSEENYSFLKQTIRTNNAAVAAIGTQKPTSVFTVASVPGKLDRVAHLSEYIDTYLLADNESLESFLTTEMANGIWAKINALGVAAFTGATGTTTQAFQGNAMDSIYLGASKAEDLGFHPDVVLISRADFDAIALAKDTAGNYLYRTPGDSRINGLAPIISTGLAAKQAIVLDSSKVGISVDKLGVLTKWDAITKLDYNQTRVLVETRAAIDIFAPAAIVKVGTAV